MHRKAQVAVIGAGPAGLAAAQILFRHGAEILIIDENRSPGGQLLRQGRDQARVWPREVHTSGKILQSSAPPCPALNRAQVLGLEADGCLWVEDGQGRMLSIQADIVLMAPGARERFVPFPGWTLPGVMSTGAVQLMLKESRVLAGQNMLLAGCTPLLYALGAEIVASKGRVQGIVDQAGLKSALNLLFAAGRAGSPLAAALGSMFMIRRGRVPVHRQRKILAARGSRELEQVVTVKLDGRGEPVPGSEQTHSTRVAAVGHGFVPQGELPAQAGCRLIQDVHPGAWAVEVDERMQTSLPAVYAAGEATGIGGGGKAMLEGRMAAWAILQDLGLVPKAEADGLLERLRARRGTWLAYGRAVHTYCRPLGPSLWDLPGDTVICRCENVTLAEVKGRVEEGFHTLGALKKSARCGMGMCQGRTCQPIVSEMLAERFPDVHVQPPSARMPVKAVSVVNLARKHEPEEGDN